jgi:DNA topoisomerase-3
MTRTKRKMKKRKRPRRSRLSRLGDVLALKGPHITSHERKPPKSFTEAAILTAMKKHGLGTPATRDSIIESLVHNEYCFRKGKSFLPADKANFFLDSIGKLGHEGLSKYLDAGNTGEWESLLESEPDKFFKDIKEFVSSTIASLKGKDVSSFQNSVGACPACGAAVVPGKYSFHCASIKDKGCQFSIQKIICGADVTEGDIKSLLAGKKTGLKSMKSKNGNAFKARLKLSEEFKVLFEFQDVKEAK